MITPDKPFALTAADRNSATWAGLKAHLTHKLEALRKQNDNTMEQDKTIELRAKIAVYKSLLALDADRFTID